MGPGVFIKVPTVTGMPVQAEDVKAPVDVIKIEGVTLVSIPGEI